MASMDVHGVPSGIRDLHPQHIEIDPHHDIVVTVASGGGAKHRSVDPPTPRHNVATRHAVATLIHGG